MPVWDTLNDLKDALHGDTVRNNPTDPELQDLGHPQVSGEGVKEHGLQSKIKDIINTVDGGRHEEENRLRIEKERDEAKKKVEADRSWTGKIHDKLDGGKHRNELEETEFKRIHQEAQYKRNQDASFVDRLSDVILDDKNSDPSQKFHTLTGTTPNQEKKQPERGWLGDKLNEMAGGGKKGEADEDKLDKAVDFVQEHILKKGDQSNESALEQLKDEQISDAIRATFKSVTGHELSVKDK